MLLCPTNSCFLRKVKGESIERIRWGVLRHVLASNLTVTSSVTSSLILTKSLTLTGAIKRRGQTGWQVIYSSKNHIILLNMWQCLTYSICPNLFVQRITSEKWNPRLEIWSYLLPAFGYLFCYAEFCYAVPSFYWPL